MKNKTKGKTMVIIIALIILLLILGAVLVKKWLDRSTLDGDGMVNAAAIDSITYYSGQDEYGCSESFDYKNGVLEYCSNGGIVKDSVRRNINVDADFEQSLENIITEYGMKKWTDLAESDLQVDDGPMSEMKIEFSDGAVVSLGDYYKMPENGRTAVREIKDVFRSYMEEHEPTSEIVTTAEGDTVSEEEAEINDSAEGDTVSEEEAEITDSAETDDPVSDGEEYDIPITVCWLDEYDRGADTCMWVTPDDSAELSSLVIQAKEDVTDVKICRLTMTDVDDNGNVLYDSQQLYEQDKLTTKLPLGLDLSFAGDMSCYGISFTDAAGNARKYILGVSGMDGSAYLTASDASQWQ